MSRQPSLDTTIRRLRERGKARGRQIADLSGISTLRVDASRWPTGSTT